MKSLCFRDEPETASEMNLKHGLCEAHVILMMDSLCNPICMETSMHMVIPKKGRWPLRGSSDIEKSSNERDQSLRGASDLKSSKEREAIS